MKNKITFTIDQQLDNYLDSLVKTEFINKSAFIEGLIRKSFTSSVKTNKEIIEMFFKIRNQENYSSLINLKLTNKQNELLNVFERGGFTIVK